MEMLPDDLIEVVATQLVASDDATVITMLAQTCHGANERFGPDMHFWEKECMVRGMQEKPAHRSWRAHFASACTWGVHVVHHHSFQMMWAIATATVTSASSAICHHLRAGASVDGGTYVPGLSEHSCKPFSAHTLISMDDRFNVLLEAQEIMYKGRGEGGRCDGEHNVIPLMVACVTADDDAIKELLRADSNGLAIALVVCLLLGHTSAFDLVFEKARASSWTTWHHGPRYLKCTPKCICFTVFRIAVRRACRDSTIRLFELLECTDRFHALSHITTSASSIDGGIKLLEGVLSHALTCGMAIFGGPTCLIRSLTTNAWNAEVAPTLHVLLTILRSTHPTHPKEQVLASGLATAGAVILRRAIGDDDSEDACQAVALLHAHGCPTPHTPHTPPTPPMRRKRGGGGERKRR